MKRVTGPSSVCFFNFNENFFNLGNFDFLFIVSSAFILQFFYFGTVHKF